MGAYPIREENVLRTLKMELKRLSVFIFKNLNIFKILSAHR